MRTNQALINHTTDFLMSGGSPARILARNARITGKLDLGVLRTNDVLRKDEWKLLDDVLVDVGRDRLVITNDLRAAGLVENLGGIGITLSEYEKLSDMSAADVDFAGVTDGEKDSVTFTLVSVPVPIFHKDFSINIRRQSASVGPSGHGTPIDRTQVEVAAIKVAERIESTIFNGFPASGNPGGNLVTNQLFGLTNQTNRNTVSGGDWGTAANVTANVISAMNGVEADGYFGPFNLYVAKTQYGQLREFYTDGSGDQILDRLKRLNGLQAIRPGDRLSDGVAVLVTMRRNVIDLAIGQDMTVVEWETKGGMMVNFKVMAALTARIKDDALSGSGVNHLTGI